MFDTNERDMVKTLAEMERLARERSQFDQTAAKQVFREYLERDRRFDPYDKDKLIAHIQECRQSCATVDLQDPRLQGREARPLERRY